MTTLTIKRFLTDEIVCTKECSYITVQNKQFSGFLNETQYIALPLTKGTLYKISVLSSDSEILSLNDEPAEFLDRQFNIATYKDNNGLTHEGVTDNTIAFRLFD